MILRSDSDVVDHEESHEAEGLEIYPVNLDRVFMQLTGRELRD